jgi:DNA-binding NarL/FixJ family response regulator
VALLAASEGIEVVGEAGQGEEGVRLARATRPDVVMMEVRMPGPERDRGDPADHLGPGLRVSTRVHLVIQAYESGLAG